jgi:hypothetical protein
MKGARGVGQQWEDCQLSFRFRAPLDPASAPELLATFCGAAGMVNHRMPNMSWLGLFGVLGAAEWELVSATSSVTGDGMTHYIGYFKRPLQAGRAVDDVVASGAASPGWNGG